MRTFVAFVAILSFTQYVLTPGVRASVPINCEAATAAGRRLGAAIKRAEDLSQCMEQIGNHPFRPTPGQPSPAQQQSAAEAQQELLNLERSLEIYSSRARAVSYFNNVLRPGDVVHYALLASTALAPIVGIASGVIHSDPFHALFGLTGGAGSFVAFLGWAERSGYSPLWRAIEDVVHRQGASLGCFMQGLGQELGVEVNYYSQTIATLRERIAALAPRQVTILERLRSLSRSGIAALRRPRPALDNRTGVRVADQTPEHCDALIAEEVLEARQAEARLRETSSRMMSSATACTALQVRQYASAFALQHHYRADTYFPLSHPVVQGMSAVAVVAGVTYMAAGAYTLVVGESVIVTLSSLGAGIRQAILSQLGASADILATRGSVQLVVAGATYTVTRTAQAQDSSSATANSPAFSLIPTINAESHAADGGYCYASANDVMRTQLDIREGRVPSCPVYNMNR